MNHAPRIYGEETADWIMRDLTETIRKEFLRVRAGRPAEIQKHLQETREAVSRLLKNGTLSPGLRPTQAQVAEEIGVSERSIRGWLRSCKLTWEEWLTASQWDSVEKADLPHDWLVAFKELETKRKKIKRK